MLSEHVDDAEEAVTAAVAFTLQEAERTPERLARLAVRYLALASTAST